MSTAVRGNEGVTLPSTVEASCSAAVDSLPHDHGTLGRYVLLRVLGHGGFGVVWEAYDPVLDRKIAVKLLMPSSVMRGQIVTEAQALARVHHQNVVAVFDAGSHEGSAHDLTYVAMELVTGRTLKEQLAEGTALLDERIDRFILAARGLEAAHAAGIVHRDFKPSNVLLGDDGRVRVSDFGLALVDGSPATGDQRDENGLSPLAGTRRYMSPEQLHGLPADARSDQFAFCVALYEAVFGMHPFGASDDATTEQLRMRLLQPPTVPPRARATARLAPVILRGLAADPTQRWPSMAALTSALESARRRRGRRYALGVALATLLAAAALVGWRSSAGPPRVCRSAANAAVLAAWSPARRAALESQFARVGLRGTDAWKRAAPLLDDWAGRWRALRIEACAGERDSAASSTPMTSRRECLDRRIGELKGLAQELDAPDDTVVNYAVRAAYGLTPPESCLAAVTSSSDQTPALKREVAAKVRASIDRASALRHLGKQKLALEQAKAAATEAASVGWSPVIAEAQLELGRTSLDANATNPATDAFYRALSTGETVRDDGVRLEAVMGLFKASLDASDFALAARWHELAAAIAQRLPADGARQARLAFDDVRLALYRGHYKECVRAGEEALAFAEKAAPNTPLVVSVLVNLSRCHGSLGDEATAVAELERALPLSEKINGHENAQTANVLTERGIHQRRAHHYDVALADYREALAVREATIGPDNPDCAAVHNNIANLLRDLGRFDESRRELERAIDIWTRAWGTDSPAVANGISGLGRIAMAQSKPAAAEPLFRRALAVWRAKRPAGHPDLLNAESLLGQALLAQHKAEAMPLFEEALAGVEHDGEATAADRADARFWAARARVELGVRSAGALSTAKASCDEVSASPAHDSAKVCRAWLAKRADAR